MLIYFLVAANTVALAGLSQLHTARRSISSGWMPESRRNQLGSWNLFDLAAVAVLVAFSAVRFQVGTDYAIYLRNYLKNDPSRWLERLQDSPLDVGYTALTLLLRLASDSPHLVFWITSVLTVVPIYATVKKRSVDLPFSVMLLIGLAFFVAPFNAIRQGVAMALNLWATTFLERRTWAFVLLNMLASTIHLTAAGAAVIQLIVRRWRPTAVHVMVALCAASMLPLLMRTEVVHGVITALLPRYARYTAPDPSGFGSYLVLLAALAFLLLGLYLSNGRPENEYAAYVTIGIAFLVVGTQYIVISRMYMYFGVFIALLIPQALVGSQLDARSKRVVKVGCVVFAACFFAAYLANYGGLLPYRTYL